VLLAAIRACQERDKPMLAAVYARKSTEQNGVADAQLEKLE
jgi:hypothetical protein